MWQRWEDKSRRDQDRNRENVELEEKKRTFVKKVRKKLIQLEDILWVNMATDTHLFKDVQLRANWHSRQSGTSRYQLGRVQDIRARILGKSQASGL